MGNRMDDQGLEPMVETEELKVTFDMDLGGGHVVNTVRQSLGTLGCSRWIWEEG